MQKEGHKEKSTTGCPQSTAITNSSKNHPWMLELLGKSCWERRYSHWLRISIYGLLINYRRKMCLYHGEIWWSLPRPSGQAWHQHPWGDLPRHWRQKDDNGISVVSLLKRYDLNMFMSKQMTVRETKQSNAIFFCLCGLITAQSRTI